MASPELDIHSTEIAINEFIDNLTFSDLERQIRSEQNFEIKSYLEETYAKQFGEVKAQIKELCKPKIILNPTQQEFLKGRIQKVLGLKLGHEEDVSRSDDLLLTIATYINSLA